MGYINFIIFKKYVRKRYFIFMLFSISLLLVSLIFAYKGGVKFFVKSYYETANAYYNAYYYNNDYQVLMKLLQTFDCFDKNGQIQIIRHGRDFDGGYVVPLKAFEKSDVLFGYGIADDISFEEEFSNKYHKPSFGFDCGIENIQIKNALTKFVPECIGTDKYLYSNQHSNEKIYSYREQLSRLGFNSKKVFIKMDIEGAEYEVFDDILAISEYVTGLVIEIHGLTHVESLLKAIKLLSDINKDFYLIHLHGNNCSNDFIPLNDVMMPAILELTYINKSLVTHAKLSADQSHPKSIDMPNCKTKKDASFFVLPQTEMAF